MQRSSSQARPVLLLLYAANIADSSYYREVKNTTTQEIERMTTTTVTKPVWYPHTSAKNADLPVVLHAYETGYFGTYATPVCGTSSFFRTTKPARKNSALPRCKRCAAKVAR